MKTDKQRYFENLRRDAVTDKPTKLITTSEAMEIISKRLDKLLELVDRREVKEDAHVSRDTRSLSAWKRGETRGSFSQRLQDSLQTTQGPRGGFAKRLFDSVQG